MKIDLNKINELIDQKYISVQKHSTLDLYIYNYTQKCQFENFWNKETMVCRGLITDSEGNVIARPFKKFFNLGEHTREDSKLPALPLEDFEVFDKLDGSLGILYWDNGEPRIATRGSFTSDQAIEANKMIKKIPSHIWNTDCTFLFEIIYPENRIVVNYGDKRELILLTVILTETGAEEAYDQIKTVYSPFISIVERFDGITDLEEIQKMVKDNAEGFVIRYKNGTRVKVKFEEYVRLHRLVTGVNAKRIWEHLKNKESLDELLDKVPDEFYKWVQDTVFNLQTKYGEIQAAAQYEFDQVRDMETRKEQALFLREYANYQGIVFTMLDKEDPAEAIWKLCRPVAEKPFKEDIDA